MATTERITLSSIVLDAGTQLREAIDEGVIAEYHEVESAAAGTLPPIAVFKIGRKRYAIVDGFHRFYAVQRTGATEISVEIVGDGAVEEAQWLACSVNNAHGLRRTNATKRAQVAAAIRLRPDASDRMIAAHVAVDGKTVAAVRLSLDEDEAERKRTRADVEDDVPEFMVEDEETDEMPEEIEETLEADQTEEPITVADRQAAAKARISALLKSLDEWHAQAHRVMTEDSGRWIHAQSFEAYFADLRLAVDRAKPAGLCSKCKGGGCPSCMGLGWISRMRAQVERQSARG